MNLQPTVFSLSRAARSVVGASAMMVVLSTGVAFAQVAPAAPKVTSSTNESPYITLADAGPGGQYIAPVAISLHATASDADGTISRIDFYSNSVLLKSASAASPDFKLANLKPGVYPFVAVARDNSGNVTVSNTITITVADRHAMASIAFAPSASHDSVVQSYRMDVFAAGADKTRDRPIATQELGKPAVVNGECTADVQALMAGLQPGSYIGTVTAVGADDIAKGQTSIQFTR